MLSAVRLVLSGGVYVPPMMLQEDFTEPASPSLGAPPSPTAAEQNAAMEHRLRELLTERQLDVMRLLSRGKPN